MTKDKEKDRKRKVIMTSENAHVEITHRYTQTCKDYFWIQAEFLCVVLAWLHTCGFISFFIYFLLYNCFSFSFMAAVKIYKPTSEP